MNRLTSEARARVRRTTPAMAAGVSAKLWEISDLVALLEQAEKDIQAA